MPKKGVDALAHLLLHYANDHLDFIFKVGQLRDILVIYCETTGVTEKYTL